MGLLRWVDGEGEGQDDGEGAALTELTLHPNAALVLFHNAFADGEAQTCPSPLARVRGIHLLELIEDVVEFVGGDAAPLVLDGDEEMGGWGVGSGEWGVGSGESGVGSRESGVGSGVGSGLGVL